MLQQVLAVSLLAAMAAAPSARSQGIRPGSCATCSTVTTAVAVKVLVATPYPSNAADSASGVAVGNGIRDKLARNINGEWNVISRRDMNSNLVTWGYTPDALLPDDQARVMANKLTARVVVTTSLAKTAGGQYVANTRMVGISDDAGHVVKMSQAPGQQLLDFGGKLADQLTIMFKAYTDGKVCNDQQTASKAKAIEAANKALKLVPNYGYAEYCLGLIEMQKDSASPAAQAHFKNALIGDPMSLQSLGRVATIDLMKHDSAAVVADFQQMITIAPTDRNLAERAIRVFREFNRPDAAEQVVNAQMKLDPSSPDWPELKGNTCAYQAATEPDPKKAKVKFDCAYSAFNLEYTLDPTRGDSAFFPKIIFVAPTQADSLTWARRYAEKYPASIDALKVEAEMFVAAGIVDSAVTVANLITRLDSTEYKASLAVAIALLNAKRDSAALQFLPFFKKTGDETAKNSYATILVAFADTASKRTPPDDSMMVHLGRAIVDLNPPNKQFVEFGHYFIVLALADSLSPLSQSVRSDKSCDKVKRYDLILAELEPSLMILTASANTGLSGYGNKLLPAVQSERKQIPQLQTSFSCH